MRQVWKIASDDNRTKTIAQDKHIQSSITYEEVTSTTNPNVDVEIMDADLLLATAAKQKSDKIQKNDAGEKN